MSKQVKGRGSRQGPQELGYRATGLVMGSTVLLAGLLDGTFNALPHVETVHLLYAGAGMICATFTGKFGIGKS